MGQMAYEIRTYDDTFREGVIAQLAPLWRGSREEREAYFHWKYDLNPFSDGRYGVVTLDRGAVVAFRGYFASKWRVPDCNDTVAGLCPGDTVTSVSHRRRGLSVRMGEFARKAFRQSHPIMVNFSCSRASLPGYLRLGFLPLKPKQELTLSHRPWALSNVIQRLPGRARRPLTQLSLVRRLLRTGREAPSPNGNGAPRNGIVSSDVPIPDLMAGVCARNRPADCVHLEHGPEYFGWRYANPRGRYRHFLLYADSDVVGFLVTASNPDNPRVRQVVDYASSAASHITTLIEYVMRTGPVERLTIDSFGLNHAGSAALSLLAGTHSTVARCLANPASEQPPVMLSLGSIPGWGEHGRRAGLDLSNPAHWDFRPACSDAV
jgi:hypothetical protein